MELCLVNRKSSAQKLRDYMAEKYGIKFKNPYWKCDEKQTKQCVVCTTLKSSIFYTWTSMVTKDVLGSVCEKCMIKERFGRKHKTNKAYQRWINERDSQKSNTGNK